MTYTQKAPEFLSTREAAELIRVNERSILNYRKTGRLPFAKLDSGAVRFRREHVLALMKDQPAPAAPKSWTATRPSDDDLALPPMAMLRPVRKAAGL
jgi:excisionase family DNA binding protein